MANCRQSNIQISVEELHNDSAKSDDVKYNHTSSYTKYSCNWTEIVSIDRPLTSDCDQDGLDKQTDQSCGRIGLHNMRKQPRWNCPTGRPTD